MHQPDMRRSYWNDRPRENPDRYGIVLHGSLAFLVTAAVLLAAGVTGVAFAFAADALVAILGVAIAMLTSWLSGRETRPSSRSRRFQLSRPVAPIASPSCSSCRTSASWPALPSKRSRPCRPRLL